MVPPSQSWPQRYKFSASALGEAWLGTVWLSPGPRSPNCLVANTHPLPRKALRQPQSHESSGFMRHASTHIEFSAVAGRRPKETTTKLPSGAGPLHRMWHSCSSLVMSPSPHRLTNVGAKCLAPFRVWPSRRPFEAGGRLMTPFHKSFSSMRINLLVHWETWKHIVKSQPSV